MSQPIPRTLFNNSGEQLLAFFAKLKKENDRNGMGVLHAELEFRTNRKMVSLLKEVDAWLTNQMPGRTAPPPKGTQIEFTVGSAPGASELDSALTPTQGDQQDELDDCPEDDEASAEKEVISPSRSQRRADEPKPEEEEVAPAKIRPCGIYPGLPDTWMPELDETVSPPDTAITNAALYVWGLEEVIKEMRSQKTVPVLRSK